MKNNKPKKICVITCYKDPDYIRGRTIRDALATLPAFTVIDVKNSSRGILRYPQVIIKTLVARLKHRPDIYLLTFRGYELLPFIRIISLGKPFVYDEFLNPIEWTVHEHGKVREKSLAAKIIWAGYRFWLKTVDMIVTDTASHAQFSAKLMRLPLKKYFPIIVSTDEKTFAPRNSSKKRAKNTPFTVFYYSNMLPLHGIGVVLEAAHLIKDKDIQIQLVGGGKPIADAVMSAQANGAHVTHTPWIPYEELPGHVQKADVCLAGPFGGTLQSQYVITGKTYQFMSAGCPVIVGKNKESGIFSDKKDALVVEQANPQALADALRWGLAHRDKLAEIGKNGQKFYQTKLSNAVLAQELATLFAKF